MKQKKQTGGKKETFKERTFRERKEALKWQKQFLKKKTGEEGLDHLGTLGVGHMAITKLKKIKKALQNQIKKNKKDTKKFDYSKTKKYSKKFDYSKKSKTYKTGGFLEPKTPNLDDL